MTSEEDAWQMPHKKRRMLIASRLKKARENCGLSQRDVAKAMHIGASTYCRIERGITEASAAQIATMSGLCEVSILWLLGIPSYIIDAVQSSSSSS
jgi:transcriptional regulator with XRE-family HTH domain